MEYLNSLKINNEDDAFNLLEEQINDVNLLTDSINFLLKHSRILFFLAILLLVVGQPKFIWIGTFFFWLIVFLKASNKNSKRIVLTNNIKSLIILFEQKGLINDTNKHLLKNFKIKPLWFEDHK